MKYEILLNMLMVCSCAISCGPVHNKSDNTSWLGSKIWSTCVDKHYAQCRCSTQRKSARLCSYSVLCRSDRQTWPPPPHTHTHCKHVTNSTYCQYGAFACTKVLQFYIYTFANQAYGPNHVPKLKITERDLFLSEQAHISTEILPVIMLMIVTSGNVDSGQPEAVKLHIHKLCKWFCNQYWSCIFLDSIFNIPTCYAACISNFSSCLNWSYLAKWGHKIRIMPAFKPIKSTLASIHLSVQQ